MNLFNISWKYLLARPLNTTLNILILSLGVAIITVLLLVSHQVEDKLTRNAQGIDVVVGAKGSPIQIILSAIFHIDYPTGNIKLAEATRLAKNPLIKWVIPMALGDSHNGFRIVGTNHLYTEHYQANLAVGQLWEKPMEITAGATVAQQLGLQIGDTFAGAHGLGQATSHLHEETPYRLVGILQPTGSVLDNLLLTSVPSIWLAHEHQEEQSEEHQHDDEHDHEGHDHSHHASSPPASDSYSPSDTKLPNGGPDQEITAMLVKFRSPMGAIQLPRYINAETGMQAAAPAFEVARLFSLLGIGATMIQGFAYLMVFIAVLSIFIALYNALKERKYDLAIMRSLGCSKQSLFLMVLLEGFFITLQSSLLGMALGHLVLEMATQWFQETDQVGVTGWMFLPSEWAILLATQAVGIVAALIPALQAYRTDISKVLAQG